MARESKKERARRRSRRALSAIFALASALAVGGCGATPFIAATDSFSRATLSGVGALAPSFATASSVCHMRARMHFLATRELGDNDTEWTAWYARHKLGKTEFTWKDQCDALRSADEMLKKGLAAIAAYARALALVVSTGTYDGESLAATVKDAAALGALLAQNNTPTKPLTDKVEGLGSPIGFLGQQLLQGYVAKELRESIKSSAPHVAAILAALKAYNEAVAATFTDAESLLNNAVNAANSALLFEDYGRAEARARALDESARRLAQDPKAAEADQKKAAAEARLAAEDAQEAFDYMTRKAPSGEHRVWRRVRPDAVGVLTLDGFVLRSEAELSAVRTAWAAWAATLNSLDKANSAMLDAASGKLNDSDAKKLVLGSAADVESYAETLKKAMEQGRTDP